MFGFYQDRFVIFGLTITYYGLIIACAIALGIFIACKNAKARGFKSEDILLAACYVVPLAIIGARIYYVLFSLENYTSFVQVLRIWDGGVAIYGAVIGGALALGLYCLIHKKNFFDLADVVVPSLILGQAIGRIGCYFAGCCYGITVTDPKLQWFPLSTFEHGAWHLSTFFYESIWNALVFVALMLMLRKFKMKQRGVIAGFYLILYGTGRAWIEALRGDSLMLGSVKVSQLLSILLIAAGIALVLFYYFWYKKHPASVRAEITVNKKKGEKVKEAEPSEVAIELSEKEEEIAPAQLPDSPSEEPNTKPNDVMTGNSSEETIIPSKAQQNLVAKTENKKTAAAKKTEAAKKPASKKPVSAKKTEANKPEAARKPASKKSARKTDKS